MAAQPGGIMVISKLSEFFQRPGSCKAAAVALTAMALCGAVQAQQPQPASAIGSLAVLLPNGKAGSGIEVPDVEVTLRDGGGKVVATAATQIDGSFRLAAPGQGVYQLCWVIQGRADCKREVVLKPGANALRKVEVRLPSLLLHGRVLTGDNRPCWVNDPFFSLDVSTRMSLSNSQGQSVGTVRANSRGDYLFAVDTAGSYQVRANCENARATATASLTGSALQVDLQLPNHAPRIVELAARDGGKSVTQAAPGTPLKLTVAASDRNGDTVEYLWRDNDGKPLVAEPTGSMVRVAAAAPGRHSSYVVARDRRGGYAFKRIDIEVGKPDIQLSGIAIDETTRAPIANAVAEFGSLSTRTNAQGWFSLTGPANKDERYVLNIHHPGYAVASRVYDRSSTGNTYELIAAQVTRHAAGDAIDVVDTSSGGPCGKGKEAPPTHQPPARKLQTVEYVDPESKDHRPLGADLIRKLTDTPPCQHLGARIRIPAGALVDAGKGKPASPIRMAMATLDPTRRALPGDYQAVDRNGSRSELLSYGAVFAEFQGNDGKPLNLLPGTVAEVRVPVPLAQRATAKPVIDFWSYDEKNGRWVFEGEAKLVNGPSGPEYVGQAKHFSTLNMDVSGLDPAVSTCVRFEVGASLAAWSNLKLRATVSYNGNAVQTKETFLNADQYHAVFRIPFGTTFPPNTLRVELFGTFAGQSVVLVDNIINTDARPKMTGTDLWPDHPYSECGVPVVLNADPIALPAYATNDATGRPYFLTGPGGAFLPPDGDATATAYYAAIDPGNAKDELGKWWGLNGFNALDGTGGTRAPYLNHNDLGFGRDMHCRQNGPNMACYVTNYGAADQNPANADDAETQNVAKRGATVAMEYNEADGTQAVQFYVFANTGPSSVRLKFADLDGFGPKPVPQLCLVCHGGNPTLAASGKAEHARFREFDLPSFKYSGNRSWDFGAATLSAAELNAFATLNQLVSGTTPLTSPVHALIGNWYPGAVFVGAPVLPTPPAGWLADTPAYHEVYGKTCRTCHLARDGGSSPPGYFTFNSLSNFLGTDGAVCGAGRVMPNAIVTYKNFWADTPRVLAFEVLMGLPLGTCQND
jgi:hypothetical protein